MTRCFFTIDLEDWYQLQVHKLYGQIIVVDENFCNALDDLLQLLNQRQIQATFFVLGILAKTNPEILTKIAEQGHEIGSHGMYHINYRNVADEIWKNDIIESKIILESVLSKKVIGFRAPFFAAPENYKDYLKFLSSLGFLYDSSYQVSPFLKKSIKKLEYGASFPLSDEKIMEVTPSYYSKSIKIPLYGGSYFRLLPTNILVYLLNKFKGNLMFYMHPYEIYKRPLEVIEKPSSILDTLRIIFFLKFNNYNRKSFMSKLKILTSMKYKFVTLENFCHENRNAK